MMHMSFCKLFQVVWQRKAVRKAIAHLLYWMYRVWVSQVVKRLPLLDPTEVSGDKSGVSYLLDRYTPLAKSQHEPEGCAGKIFYYHELSSVEMHLYNNLAVKFDCSTCKRGCCTAQRQHTCFSTSSPGFDSQHSPKKFRLIRQHWLGESGKWFENVDRTHLILARGKPVQQQQKHF